MLNLRHALTAAVAAVALVPVGHAQASLGGAEVIRDLADDAVDLLVEELSLVEQIAATNAVSPAELDAVRAQLRAVDGQGQSILVQLSGLGVTLTPAIETALDRLPDGATSGAASTSLLPQAVVYAAAIDDLARIAATPSAVTAGGGDSNGPSSALLLVAAVSLLILGSAALANALWRRPDDITSEAWTDGLTGLATRRRLDHDLQHTAIERPTAAIVIDVAYLRNVDGSCTHQIGDDLIKRLGTVFERHVRINDVLYRYGDQTFCVLLPDADAADAHTIADRIVEAASDIDLPNGANVTVSVGITGGVGAGLVDALEHADRALHLAQQHSRDETPDAARRDLVTNV